MAPNAAPGQLAAALPIILQAGAYALAGLFVASVVHAVWLRIACACVGVGQRTFLESFKTTFMATAVFTSFGYLMTVGIILAMGFDRSDYVRMNLAYYVSPANFVHAAIALVLGHAAIFSYRLGSTDGSSLPFAKATALALVYLGICNAFAIFIWFMGVSFVMTMRI